MLLQSEPSLCVQSEPVSIRSVELLQLDPRLERVVAAELAPCVRVELVPLPERLEVPFEFVPSERVALELLLERVELVYELPLFCLLFCDCFSIIGFTPFAPYCLP